MTTAKEVPLTAERMTRIEDELVSDAPKLQETMHKPWEAMDVSEKMKDWEYKHLGGVPQAAPDAPGKKYIEPWKCGDVPLDGREPCQLFKGHTGLHFNNVAAWNEVMMTETTTPPEEWKWKAGVPAAPQADPVNPCDANWPEAVNGEYNPRCCRFPKSCSVQRAEPNE